MALSTPGPTITVDSIVGTAVKIAFSNLPAGGTTHWLAWGRPAQAVQTIVEADASNEVTITAPSNQFVVAAGFSYGAGSTIYGPGPFIAFTAPYNIFPNFAANHDTIQAILGQMGDKLTVDEYKIYADVVDVRLRDIESDQTNLTVRISELMAAIAAALRRLISP